jgi:hypothetical protein
MVTSTIRSQALSPLPPPGWYPDPSSSRIYRWWDGQAWTKHTSVGQPVAVQPPAPVAAVQVPEVASAPVFATAQFPSAQLPTPSPANAAFAPNRASAGTSIWRRNQLAFTTMGIVAVYLVLAAETHIVMLGLMPIMMSARSWQRKERLAGVAVCAAIVAVLVSFLAITGN